MVRTTIVLAVALAATLAGAQTPDPTPAPPPAEHTDELDAPTFLGVYAWRLATWQQVEVVDEEGNVRGSIQEGGTWGGRVVAGLGFGRFGLEARADVAGLPDQFDVEDVGTYQTLELYAAAHYVAWNVDGVQVGPAIMGGFIVDDQATDALELNVYGAGARFGFPGGELFALVSRNDYLRGGGTRFGLAVHVPIGGGVYAVGDLVTGVNGYARAGVAYRAK